MGDLLSSAVIVLQLAVLALQGEHSVDLTSSIRSERPSCHTADPELARLNFRNILDRHHIVFRDQPAVIRMPRAWNGKIMCFSYSSSLGTI
jgi:hypothetical protein